MRLKAFVFISIILWCGIFLSQKIDLTTADIGRHIVNGRVLVEAPRALKAALLKTNFYSYTMPSADFVNHHWASGVIFYLTERVSGFTGLSVLYVLVSLAAIVLFWNVARHLSGFYIASILAIIITPILVSRAEVRPEMWSYLLSGVFLNLLYFQKRLWLLPILMMLWVNLHIGFIFGFLILGSFALADFKKLWKIGVLTVLAGFINPFGYKIILYPFLIFRDYGYRIVENQSVSFLENIGVSAGQHFLLFKIIAAVVILSVILLRYYRVKIPIQILLPTIITGVMAYLGIRHFPIFGLFALVFLSYGVYKLVIPKLSWDVVTGVSTVLIALAIVFGIQDISREGFVFGWGLEPGVLGAAEFIKTNNIRGPIFNNYDVGGYLIYAGKEVFVDNRPEAYTKEFFEEIYVPAQENESVWQKLDEQYKFNSIVFSHRDYTPWGQRFLKARLDDKDWKPVFADSHIIIFSKNK